MKASLRLEAAQRPQWPRLYLLSRPRSRGRMPSLVGDGGQVLQVLGWALTRIRNLPLVRYSQAKGAVSLVPRPSATTPRRKIREGKKEGGSGK